MGRLSVSIIAAIGAHDRALGKNNKLLWTVPDDLKRFRALTRGHPVIMGRKTFESILSYTGGKPLPDRPNIVVTRIGIQKSRGPSSGENVIATSSIEEAIEKAKGLDQEEIFVIGGGQIYEAALPYVDKLYLTLIDDRKEADSFFPAYQQEFTKEVFEESHEYNGIKYRWIDLERK